MSSFKYIYIPVSTLEENHISKESAFQNSTKFQKFLNNFINEYFPTSIFAIIGKYSSGVVYDILSWVLVLFLIWFLIYLVKYLFGCR